MDLKTVFRPSESETAFLEAKLFRHNCREIEHYAYEDFVIKSEEGSGTIVGGIHCQVGGGWLYVASLWVEEEHRGRGLKRLLAQAEMIALQKQCRGAYLYTYGFQNPGFYQKLGYDVFGALEQFTETIRSCI